MVQLAIRCHPRVPLSADELEGWLELEVKDLRAQALRDMRLLGLQPTLLTLTPTPHTNGQTA
jgi:hypothetical protein